MAEAESLVVRGNRVASGLSAPSPPCEQGRAAASLLSSSCGAAARSQSRLHNFSFPSMSWGTQRLLRCVKLDQRGVSPSARSVLTAESGGSVKRRRSEGAEEGGRGEGDGDGEGEDGRLRKFGEAMVEKFQKAADRNSPPRPLEPRREENKGDLGPSPSAAVEEASKPWNLRPRRATASDAPSVALESGARKATKTQEQSQSLLASENRSAAGKCSRRRRRWEAASEEEEERPRFSSVLSRDEIEEDFLLMTGSKPPRRPKKRPRNVQKQIEMLCPGSYLTEVTPDLYKTS